MHHRSHLIELLLVGLFLHGVHRLFLIVVVAEDEEEDTRGQGRDHGDTGVHPHDRRVASGGNKRLRDGGTDGGGEEVERLDERLHARGCLGVGVFETGDWEMLVCDAEVL